jgi:acetyl esterase/lipase
MIREPEEDILTVLKSNVPDPKKPLSQARKEFSVFYQEYQEGEHPETERVAINGNVQGFWIRVPESLPDHTVLFFHGGGFTVGSTQDHLGLCTWIARASRSCVFSVDYRLAPVSHLAEDSPAPDSAGRHFCGGQPCDRPPSFSP